MAPVAASSLYDSRRASRVTGHDAVVVALRVFTGASGISVSLGGKTSGFPTDTQSVRGRKRW